MPAAALVTDASTPRLDLEHSYPRHPERPQRLSAILEHLDASGLRERMVALDARDATDDEILAVHEHRVLDVQADLAGRGGGLTDPDTYVTPSSPAAARRAAGAVLVALEAVLAGDVASAFAAVRPPGHHATRETMMGFCLLNNVAIAATAALEGVAGRAGLERIAVVDWDVHHGNGTQAVFDADPRLLYFSTHAAPFYPGSGDYHDIVTGEAAGTKINVPCRTARATAPSSPPTSASRCRCWSAFDLSWCSSPAAGTPTRATRWRRSTSQPRATRRWRAWCSTPRARSATGASSSRWRAGTTRMRSPAAPARSANCCWAKSRRPTPSPRSRTAPRRPSPT